MEQKVKSVKILCSPSDFAGYASTNPSVVWSLTAGCSKDNLDINASYNSKENVFFVCPGTLLSMIKNLDAASSESNVLHEKLPFLVGHELGHSISPVADPLGHYYPEDPRTKFATEYEDWFQCLYKTFENPDRDPHMTFSGFRTYAAEMAADGWGTRTAVTLLQDEQDLVKRFQIIRNGVSTLCDTDAGGGHPTGNYRIKVLVGMNLELRTAMHCTPALTCDLNGEVTKP